ncbi:Glutathione S-transferase, C-terminal-like domain protein [Pseudohyphozyma bogoriensis]|nr:Glutathione S-transferase, C-terminal-like domain protein [Pseudohyphozyma bogoriensis]
MASIPFPPFFSALATRFPLHTFASPSYPSTPSSPTLWLLLPSSSTTHESLDPLSLTAQTYARFLEHSVDVRWLANPAGAVDGQLPSLHLPNGELLGRDEVLNWLKSPWNALGALGEKEKDDTAPDASHLAFTALVHTTLLPAVLAALYLPSPSSTSSFSHLPLLSRWAASYAASEDRQSRIAEIQKLRARKVGAGKALDLEEVERDGVETLDALEGKLKGDKVGHAWFGGALKPTLLDASIYALVNIILRLPSSPSTQGLRDKVDRCPTLKAWVAAKSISP